MQKNKSFVLTQTQHKITDQIHGKVCSHVLWLWKYTTTSL